MNLFQDRDGNVVSEQDIRKALLEIGADQCETLFIHSDIMFGTLIGGIKRKELLESLFEQIRALGVKNIIAPTFTYSFPNNEEYDIVNSKTYMGALNEYVRKMDGRYRTDDPLLSVSVPKELTSLFNHISNHSLGRGSALDVIHHMNDVKFLFFGAEMSECFTYVHYVEKIMNVPYRFDMPFEGVVIYPNGERMEKKQIIHTQCQGAVLPHKYDYFESEMQDKGLLRKRRVADKYIACLSEVDAYREIKMHIEKNINYFLEIPFKETELVYQYTYDTRNGRITHC